MNSGIDRRHLLRAGLAGSLAVGGVAAVETSPASRAEAAVRGAGPRPRIPGHRVDGQGRRQSMAYFGAFQSGSRAGLSEPATLESRLGRRLAINHSFRQPPDAPWAPLRDRMIRDRTAGRIPMLSLAAGEKPGFQDHDMAARARLRDIVLGRRDDWIDGQARALAALRTPVFLRFTWEFDLRYLGSRGAGLHQAAWRRVYTRFQARGATNVAFVWCPSWLAYQNGAAATYYPGDRYVHWIGADGYARTPENRSFSRMFTAANGFALRHHKPFMVCETGVHRLSVEESVTEGRTIQSTWLDALRGNLAEGRFTNLKALLYFHVDGDNHPLPNQWRVTDPLDGPALESFTSLAWHPRLRATR